jgi:phosphohistidine phosphatase
MVIYVRLILFRHGEAEEKKPDQRDEDRALTDKGRRDVELVAKLLPWTPSRIYSSPLRRAVETAQIISSIYGVEYEVSEYLRPDKLSLEVISRLSLVDNTVLVGHAPSIEELLSQIIGGGKIRLKSGSAAGLELDELKIGAGRLIYIITPDIINSKLLKEAGLR